MNQAEYRDDMYNPLQAEMRERISQLEELGRNLTPEKARRQLMKAGLIDENGNPTKPYQPNVSDEWITHKN